MVVAVTVVVVVWNVFFLIQFNFKFFKNAVTPKLSNFE